VDKEGGRNHQRRRKEECIDRERDERYQDEIAEMAKGTGIIWHRLDLGLLWNPEVPVEESGTNYVDNNVHPANTKVSPSGRSAGHSV